MRMSSYHVDVSDNSHIAASVRTDASIRATGMGWALGMGRVGGTLSPLITGILVDCGWVGSKLYYAFAIPVVATRNGN